ncbi:MAG: hypothetical protein KC646_18125 [Candidatus Cloacimonetes bacterium]|nr:hypothetical protein [Candidatus Cloacimonadota bacterium]
MDNCYNGCVSKIKSFGFDKQEEQQIISSLPSYVYLSKYNDVVKTLKSNRDTQKIKNIVRKIFY